MMPRAVLLLLPLQLAGGACRDKPVGDDPALARAAPTCDEAREALDAHLEKAPRSCDADAACRALYVRPDACAPPLIASASYLPDADARLRALQKQWRDVCPMAKRACEAVQVRPACRLNQCVDDRGPSGVAQRECAPSDGPAWTFMLTEGQEAMCDSSVFPVVTATIWSAVKPGDRFVLDPAKKSDGVLMRCQTAKQCVTGSGTVHLSGMHEGGWIVELDALFEGAPVKQSFLARTCPGEPRCG